MPRTIKKIVATIGLITISAVLCTNVALAIDYVQLAPLPGTAEGCVGDVGGGCVIVIGEGTQGSQTIGKYINGVYKLAVAGASVLAVLMIVIGGFTYVSSDAMGNKEEGKHQIKAAFGGILLILASYIILNTVNPQLVSLNIISRPLSARNLSDFRNIKNMALASYQQQINMNEALANSSNAYKASQDIKQNVTNLESILKLINDDPCLVNELTQAERIGLGLPEGDYCSMDAGQIATLTSSITNKINDSKLNLAITSGTQLVRDAEAALTRVVEGKYSQQQLGNFGGLTQAQQQGLTNQAIALDSGLGDLNTKYSQYVERLYSLIGSKNEAGQLLYGADEIDRAEAYTDTLKSQMNTQVDKACTTLGAYTTSAAKVANKLFTWVGLYDTPEVNKQKCLDKYSIR